MQRAAVMRAWGIIAIFALGIGGGIALALRAHLAHTTYPVMALAFATYPIVGAIILAYRPGNAIGRILVAIGFGTSTTFFSAAYINYTTLVAPLPGASFVDWLGNIVWPINVTLAALLVLLFPTGRFPSPRWRWLRWLIVSSVVVGLVSSAFTPGQFSGETTSNPYGVAALAPILNVGGFIANLALVILIVSALLAVLVRFRRSQGVERQQMKWFALGTSLLILCVAVMLLTASESNNNNVAFAIGITFVPISIGIAVLRARLYDIDIIINRALVYGSLTASLATVYFGLVIGSQALLRLLTGHGQPQQPVVIVLSTLLIAALFTPLRARIQRTIDRRFYRRKYDSARTLARFGQTLRTEVEMERLCDHLVAAVEETMQPQSVSLWLRARGSPAAQLREGRR
ncbi:MAG: hypothetical protein ACRDID_17010 [Ktedonobacterales bacterium]